MTRRPLSSIQRSTQRPRGWKRTLMSEDLAPGAPWELPRPRWAGTRASFRSARPKHPAASGFWNDHKNPLSRHTVEAGGERRHVSLT